MNTKRLYKSLALIISTIFSMNAMAITLVNGTDAQVELTMYRKPAPGSSAQFGKITQKMLDEGESCDINFDSLMINGQCIDVEAVHEKVYHAQNKKSFQDMNPIWTIKQTPMGHNRGRSRSYIIDLKWEKVQRMTSSSILRDIPTEPME